MQKVLVAADLEGHFDFLIDKLNGFIAKGESFDLVLCVGKTLSHTFDMRRFTQSDKPLIPIPLYFIDSGEFSSILSTLYPDGKEIAPNLHYLGRCGFKVINGLNIAFLSGILNDKFPEIEDRTNYYGPFYTRNDLSTIYAQVRSNVTELDVDILLTAEWPWGFDLELEGHRAPKCDHVSRLVAELAKNLKPRYHFVGLEHIYYARPPYLNARDSHITRLIAVGKMPKDASHPIKEQYLYGCKLVPMSTMSKDDLNVQTTDTTLNPFKTTKLERHASAEKKKDPRQKVTDIDLEEDHMDEGAPIDDKPETVTENVSLHFFGFDRRTSDIDIIDFLTRWGELQSYYLIYDQKRKHKGSGFVQFRTVKATQSALNDSGKFSLHGRKVNFKPAHSEGTGGRNVADCWFCLSNEKADSELIVNMGTDVYIALDKGPITPYHLLIIPIDHYSSSSQLPVKTRDEIQAIKTKLVSYFDREREEALICYERFIKMTEKVAHLHIQLIPFKKDKLKGALEYLDVSLKGSGFEFYEMEPKDTLLDVVSDEEYFFYLEVLSADALTKRGNIYERRYIHPMNAREEERFNKDFGRELVCAMLEEPDKVNWRNSTRSDQDSNRIAVEMRGKLKQEI